MAAHQHKVKARNKDFHSINTKMKLSRPDFIPWKDDKGPQYDEKSISEKFHYVFWMGDFNYRINGTRNAVDKMLALDMHEALIANDQLGIEKKRGNVFVDKFTNNYDFRRGR